MATASDETAAVERCVMTQALMVVGPSPGQLLMVLCCLRCAESFLAAARLHCCGRNATGSRLAHRCPALAVLFQWFVAKDGAAVAWCVSAGMAAVGRDARSQGRPRGGDAALASGREAVLIRTRGDGREAKVIRVRGDHGRGTGLRCTPASAAAGLLALACREKPLLLPRARRGSSRIHQVAERIGAASGRPAATMRNAVRIRSCSTSGTRADASRRGTW